MRFAYASRCACDIVLSLWALRFSFTAGDDSNRAACFAVIASFCLADFILNIKSALKEDK